MLCQYAGGERAGEGGSNEVCRHPVTIIHTSLPLHALFREPGQVSDFDPHISLYKALANLWTL